MRKFYFAALLMTTVVSASAQYKKASFLTKGGRTYDLGATGRFMGDGKSAATGFLFSYGRDKGTKRAFHWFDLEVVLPIKFSIAAKDRSTTPNTPVTVAGKTTAALIYRYNFAYYLMDNSNANNKVLPFVTAGINLLLAGNSFKDDNSSYGYKDPQFVSDGLSYGANLGAGVVYNFTPKVGLKVTGGYNLQGNYAGENYAEGIKKYYPFVSHPYITAGIRFQLHDDQ
jgi:hypothetical protein